ncbi:GNAT family N-acetyltransferase [Kineosporia mesophila]|uniref:GNAT family N-acetyltransferase n=1 Tax=Kineosporia mesophila TaxID=566012 RepID=A0ABP6Z638_9ACTN|nr:GNAT family N-acetyltransferase [Kineosporia mesophila]MCD5354793.1 GNAT family N-acetyltransferase [Kineosporia mesophila]
MLIRSTTADDLGIFIDTLHTAFGQFPQTPLDAGGRWWSALEMDRALLALTPQTQPVGTAAAYSFELTLPGQNVVPVSGVSAVSVVPTHRRQGVLTALMRHQLTQLRARGDFLAVLLASEAPIYGRFGYGPATYTTELSITHQHSPLAPPRASTPEPGSIQVLRRDAAQDLIEDLYDRYRRTQPGALSRPHSWWTRQSGQPPISPAPRYIALHRNRDGEPTGYASYALEGQTLTVDEIITTDSINSTGSSTVATFTALARFVLGHDLVSTVVLKHVPPHHPLRWQLHDFRAGKVIDDTDWLWVRLLDIPRALAARGWSGDGDLVLEVQDPFLNEHARYLLSVREGNAECFPTDREADLSLDVRDLGSLYLGGTTPSTLVQAGHIHAHHPQAAARADDLFRTPGAPHCLHWF